MHVFFPEMNFRDNLVFACIVYYDEKVESRAREPFRERQIRPLSSIPSRIEFESKAPHLGAGEPASSQPTNLN